MGLPGAFIELLFDIANDVVRGLRWLRCRMGKAWVKTVRTYQYVKPRFVLLVSFASFIVAVVAAWNIPVFHLIWREDFWDAKNGEGVRNLVLAAVGLVGGLVGLAGYLLLAVRTQAVQRQTELQWESQITDRFTKAVEQLGHKEVAVRLGAIYALERIAKDSERDFATIVETLAAFARQHANQDSSNAEEEILLDASLKRPAIDVAATIAVLARMVPSRSAMRVGALPMRIDLRRLDLRGLDLPGANLSGFRFDRCNLRNANLRGADCERASFINANLTHADIAGANLSFVSSYGAQLSGAYVTRSKLVGARMLEANLQNLQGSYADFSDAVLYSANLSEAILWRATFRGTILNSAVLNKANFDDADLTEASLAFASLEYASVSGTNFRDVRFLEPHQLALVKYFEGHEPQGLEDNLFRALPDPVEVDDEIPF